MERVSTNQLADSYVNFPTSEADTPKRIQEYVDTFCRHMDTHYGDFSNHITWEMSPYLRTSMGMASLGFGNQLGASLKSSPAAQKMKRHFPGDRCAVVQFSSSMWKVASKQQRVETIAHELGHAYAYLRHGSVTHDQFWRHAMQTMGMNDDVFHHIIRPRRTAIVCEKCGKTYEVTQQLMTRRLNRGANSICSCGARIEMFYRR